MPPKLSKADREKVKREEAERKAREEEERRAREEEEERQRQEKERIEWEEAARKKALQDARIAEETLKVKALQTEWDENLVTWKTEQAAKKEWEHYLSCSQLPLVTDERALNSWISDFRNSPVSEISSCLEDIRNCLTLCHEVRKVLEGDGYPSAPGDKLDYYQNAIQLMQSVILSKLSLPTHKCSLNADSHVSSETYNMTVEMSLPGEMVLCLWGNVAKNPRLKDFTFKERSFTLELPKPLILADILVSVLYPPFDHLTPLARSYTLQTTASDGENQVEVGPENEGEEGEREGEGEEEGEKGGETEGEGGTSQQENHTEETTDEEKEEANGAAEPEEPKKEAKEAEAEEEKTDSEEDEVNLRQYHPAGGPIVLTLLELPPPPKTAGQWTIRRVASDGPQMFVYPQELSRKTEQVAPDQSGASVEGGEVTTPPAIVPGCTQWPPLKITMSLPTPFHFHSEPLLAQWDNELNIWRTERVKDVGFDMVENTVTFQTYYFSPLAIMTDQYANMPYKHWEVAPEGLNHTRLTLAGALVQVVVDIKDRVCTLLEHSEESPVSHLIGQPMTACQLLPSLKKCGINFTPESDGHKYCKIRDKNQELEVSVYRHIAMTAASFKFSSSNWSSKSGQGNFILQCARIHSTQDPSYLYVCGESNWRLALTEDSTDITTDMAEGCEPHGDIYSTLLAESTKDILPAHSPPHMDTLYYLLSHCRPLSYTV